MTDNEYLYALGSGNESPQALIGRAHALRIEADDVFRRTRNTREAEPYHDEAHKLEERAREMLRGGSGGSVVHVPSDDDRRRALILQFMMVIVAHEPLPDVKQNNDEFREVARRYAGEIYIYAEELARRIIP